MDNKDILRKIYKDHSLEKSDVFVLKMGGREIPIITRSGIEKIQYKNNIQVKFEMVCHDPNNVIIKAIAYSEKKQIETYGEASGKNCKNVYPIAMAEKRALSRVVLKMVGVYELGVFGEDEIAENEKLDFDVDQLEQLLKTSSLKTDAQMALDIKNISSVEQYQDIKFTLECNQLGIRDGNQNFGAKEIKGSIPD